MNTTTATPVGPRAGVRTVRSRSVLAHDRLDAAFFAASGVEASDRVALLEAAGVPMRPLGSFARVWDPARFARAWAAPREEGLPYLRPYDVFDYLPTASERLSTARNDDVSALRLREGTILQTCSGRNLGPCSYVDADLARFTLSHDMIRIEVDDEPTRLLVLAYLQTPTGQALLRRGRSGSVIDHLTVADVAAVPVPQPPPEAAEPVIALMRHALARRQSGRQRLRTLLDALATRLPPPRRSAGLGLGPRWQLQSTTVGDRLDAAHHDPLVRAAQAQVAAAAGVRCGALAAATLPVRYKRYYVDGGHGRPIVSGRQLLQAEPINLRRVSDRSFRDPSAYELRTGMVIFGAVGRAEGRQGWPSLITAGRHGWLASNDVMRLEPYPGARPGALWLGLASAQAQLQVKALSFGSVVDHMNPGDVEQVLLPAIDDATALDAEQAWRDLDDASRAARAAADQLQQYLDQG